MAIKIYHERFTQYLDGLSEKDKKALFILTIFLGIVLLVYGLFLPAFDYQTQAKSRYTQEQALHQWLADQQAFISVKTNQTIEHKQSGSALSIVNASAKEFELILKRVQPEGNGLLRVWLENADFTSTLKWMENLNQQGLTIIELNVDGTAAGIVNLRLSISSNTKK